MQTVARAVQRSGNTGQPLSTIYSSLSQRKANFRRGGTSMVAGPPGAFKSTLALNLVKGWAESGHTGIYVSADSDEFTVGKRCAAIITGDPMDIVEKGLRSGKYSSALRSLNNIHWEFRALDVEAIDLRMHAFHHMYGHHPDFLVVDNLMNCVAGPADFQGQIQMTRDLDDIARANRSHIMILHHTSEQWQEQLPPPRWEIQGKVSQFPRLVFTMNCVVDRMMLAVVKNTNGPQDPTGRDYVDFLVNTENARVVELHSGSGPTHRP